MEYQLVGKFRICSCGKCFIVPCVNYSLLCSTFPMPLFHIVWYHVGKVQANGSRTPQEPHRCEDWGLFYPSLCCFHCWSPPYQALVCDSYHCVVTGFINYASVKQYPDQLGALNNAYGLHMTTCTHIFASFTSWDISGDNANRSNVNDNLPLWSIDSFTWLALQHEYAGSAWAVMEWMGAINVITDLNGNGVHCLENVMTMEVGIHDFFVWQTGFMVWSHGAVSLSWISNLSAIY